MSRWKRVSAAGLLVAAFLVHFRHWNFLVDDSYISFRYAANLVDGHGLVYNSGELVEGYSNFLWVMLLAGIAFLGGKIALAARALGFVLALGTLPAVYVLARRRLATSEATALATCALLVTSVPWMFWAGAGLETTLMSVLLLATWALVTSRYSSATFAVLALLALTRPEGAIAFPFVLGYVVFMKRIRVPFAALAFVVPFAIHLLWRHAYYGDWLPNPYYAKIGGGPLSAVLRGLTYLETFIVDEGFWWVVPLLVVGAIAKFRDSNLVVLWSILVVYLAFIVGVGGDGLYRHRFFAHIAPLLALAAAPGIEWLTTRHRLAPLEVAAVAIAALAYAVSDHAPFFGRSSFVAIRANEDRWEEVGRAIAASAPPDLLVATNAAGKLPFLAERPTIDLLGLCDRTIAHTPSKSIGTGYAGHERAAPDYVITRAPDLIYLSVLDGAPPDRFASAPASARLLERTPLQGYASLFERPEMLDAYRPAVIDLGAGTYANVLAKRTGAARKMTSVRWLRWMDRAPAVLDR